VSLLEYLLATEIEDKVKGGIFKEKDFGKGEVNSYKKV
jgi:hypothetical protein